MTRRRKYTIDLCNQIGTEAIKQNESLRTRIKEMFELAALEGLIPAGGSLHFNLHLDVRVNDPSVLGQEGVTSVSENILNGTFTNGK